MIQVISIMILFQLLKSCPLKNSDGNVLPQGNLIQTTQYNVSEENKYSFCFNFWIQPALHFNPRAHELFEKPFNQEKNESGQIIFRIYQEDQLVFLFHSAEIQFEYLFFLALNSSSFYYSSIDSFLNYSPESLFSGHFNWMMVLITAIPDKNQIIIEISELVKTQKIQILEDIVLNNKLTLVLGGHCFINNELNLNIFKGRITKLNLISPALWNEEFFQNLTIFCRVPEKFIESFGNYSFFQRTCSYECETCLEGQPEFCTSCDEKLNMVLTPDFKCECSKGMEWVSIGISRNFICVPMNIISTVLEIIEVPIKQLSCQFGYFSIYKNDEIICMLCPNYSDNIVCIECLRYMDNWYKKPVCKADFILVPLQQDTIYQYRARLSKNFETYLIDDFNQLNYLNGVEDFCDEEGLEETCIEYAQNHLGKKPFIKCKKGFFPINGLCVYQIQNSYLQLFECLSGQYYFEGNCLACPIGCSQCNQSQDNGIVICNFCQPNFYLIQNKCMRCGQFCQKCVLFNDEMDRKPYLKCRKCVDDSKYFFSFDGINCLENLIKNCEYAFQVFNSSLMISTLDYDFIPQYNSQNIETQCAKCYDNFIFIRSTHQCFLPKFVDCLYGIADKVIYDEQEQEQLINFICLISKNNNLMPKEFEDCSQIMENCLKCYINQCILCEQGYYKSRISGKCYKCYLKDCDLCVQQTLQEEDGWKENIRPFYQFIINKLHHQSLNLKLFSRNGLSNDFNVKCQKCSQHPHIKLFNGKCQSYCDRGCIGCEIINGKLICNFCSSNIRYKSSVEYQGNCIFCNENCNACFVRSLSEISLINPYYLFNNSDENYYQCKQYN